MSDDLQKKYDILVETLTSLATKGCHHDLQPTRLFKKVTTVEEASQQEFEFYDGYMKSMDSTVRSLAKSALTRVGITELKF